MQVENVYSILWSTEPEDTVVTILDLSVIDHHQEPVRNVEQGGQFLTFIYIYIYCYNSTFINERVIV